jgi:hypothetical protein
MPAAATVNSESPLFEDVQQTIEHAPFVAVGTARVVRRDDHVGHIPQRRFREQRLVFEHIEIGAGEMAAL